MGAIAAKARSALAAIVLYIVAAVASRSRGAPYSGDYRAALRERVLNNVASFLQRGVA